MKVKTFPGGASVSHVVAAIRKGFIVDCDCGRSMYDDDETGQERYGKWCLEFAEKVEKQYQQTAGETKTINILPVSPDDDRLARLSVLDLNKISNQEAVAFLQGSDWL